MPAHFSCQVQIPRIILRVVAILRSSPAESEPPAFARLKALLTFCNPWNDGAPNLAIRI